MNQEIQKEIIDKYHKLLWNIASWVNGDSVIYSREDVYQDLVVALIETTRKFQEKTDLGDDEVLDSSYFDKYVKTSLWNHKNTMGRKILNSRKNVDIDLSLIEIEEPEKLEVPEVMSEKERRVLDVILNEHSFFSESTKLNYFKIAESSGIAYHLIRKVVNNLRKHLN